MNLPGNNQSGANRAQAQADANARAASESKGPETAQATSPAAEVNVNKVGDKSFEASQERVVGSSSSFSPAVELEVEQPDDGGLRQTLAEIHAADVGVGISDQGGTIWSSHPIANLTFGPFQFEKTILRLDDKDNAAFEKLLATMPATERNRVQKIDEKAAAAIVTQRLDSQATKEFDSSVGMDTLAKLRAIGPTVGVGKLGETFTNQAQQDMNAPVASGAAGAEAIQEKSKTDDPKTGETATGDAKPGEA
jgi:hypothetical protein